MKKTRIILQNKKETKALNFLNLNTCHQQLIPRSILRGITSLEFTKIKNCAEQKKNDTRLTQILFSQATLSFQITLNPNWSCNTKP